MTRSPLIARDRVHNEHPRLSAGVETAAITFALAQIEFLRWPAFLRRSGV